MVIRVIGDTNFDGKFQCEFIDGIEKHYKLNFSLQEWESVKEHGLYGGTYLEMFTPHHIKLQFDNEYDVSIEDARTVYEVLYSNGWR